MKTIEECLIQRGYAQPILSGKGAFSDLYRVHSKEGRFLACKVCEVGSQAICEARLLKELKHPLFPAYVEHWQEEGRQYLVMEYLFGSTLKQLIERRGSLGERQTARIAMELAEGLGHLHDRTPSVIYRDLKPENVMLLQNGRVKLLDMGCAWVKEGTLHCGSVAGSPGYSAPEQFTASECPGEESDVYALGRLIRYLLTGTIREDKAFWTAGRKSLLSIANQASCRDRHRRTADMKLLKRQLEPFCREQRRFHKQPFTDFYYIENIKCR